MVRSQRGTGVKALGGRPTMVTPTLRVACPVCSAGPGVWCQVWRVQYGERLYVDHRRANNHGERVAAGKAAGG